MATCNNISVNLPDNNDKTVETTVMLNFTQQLFKYVGKGLCYCKLLDCRLFYSPEKKKSILFFNLPFIKQLDLKP